MPTTGPCSECLFPAGGIVWRDGGAGRSGSRPIRNLSPNRENELLPLQKWFQTFDHRWEQTSYILPLQQIARSLGSGRGWRCLLLFSLILDHLLPPFMGSSDACFSFSPLSPAIVGTDYSVHCCVPGVWAQGWDCAGLCYSTKLYILLIVKTHTQPEAESQINPALCSSGDPSPAQDRGPPASVS